MPSTNERSGATCLGKGVRGELSHEGSVLEGGMVSREQRFEKNAAPPAGRYPDGEKGRWTAIATTYYYVQCLK